MLVNPGLLDETIRRSDCDPPTMCDLEAIPQDTWFNPYRTPQTGKALAVVRDVTGQVQSLENYRNLRQRARRPKDQQAFEGIVSAIVSDLIHFHLLGKQGGLVVTRSNTILGKRSRYRPQIYNQTFPVILDRLASPEMAFIDQAKGHVLNFEADPCRTTIRPAKRLVT